MLITIKFMRVMESTPVTNFKQGARARRAGAGSAFVIHIHMFDDICPTKNYMLHFLSQRNCNIF